MFRLRITLLSVLFSGIILVIFGLFFLSLTSKMELDRIDREIQTLGESQLVVIHPKEHWAHFDAAIKAIYGDQSTNKLIMKVVGDHDRTLYVTPGWPTQISEPFPAFPPPVPPPPRLGPDVRRPIHLKQPFPPENMKKPLFRTFHLPDRDWRVGIMGNVHLTIIIGMDLTAYNASAKTYGTLFMIAIPIALLLVSGCDSSSSDSSDAYYGTYTIGATVSGLAATGAAEEYPIVDTGQDRCFNNSEEMSCPTPGQAFYGQDAQYQGHAPSYRDNGDGTVTDLTTGLMWQKGLNTKKVSLDEAREMARNLRLGGYSDWRLPNAKALQSIVDYSRSPDTTGSPAIDPIFETTPITNEAGQEDFPFFWTSTTHLDGPRAGSMAAYIAFGRAIGAMRGKTMDVHGAGAQRSDPKTGSSELGHGPQGDARRVNNYVRCVRGGTADVSTGSPLTDRDHYPYKIRLVDNLPGVPGHAARQNMSHIPAMAAGDGNPPRTGMNKHRPSGTDMRQLFIRRLDKDEDRRVSRSEFDGPPGRFDIHDTDHDGYISIDEAPEHPPARGRQD